MKNRNLLLKTQLLFLITLLCALVTSSQNAHAATTWTVQSTGDGAANTANCPGAGCRLRDALAAAADGDTINFSVTTPATITLDSSSGYLLVESSVIISGPGADHLTVDGNHSDHVFRIAGDPQSQTVTISGLTIANGNSAFTNGGGIENLGGSLTVNNCTISGNSASGVGGGIASLGGLRPLTVNNCTISGNSASASGGGIAVAFATLTVNNCTISGNSASDFGGGIYCVGTSATVNNCTISGNSASVLGGGIANAGGDSSRDGAGFDGTLTVNNSTISGNSASGRGGGIANRGGNLGTFAGGNGTLTVRNSTISGNSANDGAGIDNTANGSGGTTLTVNNSTISGNSVSILSGLRGGGIFNYGATVTVSNSTLSDNFAYQGAGILNYVGGGMVTIGSTILNKPSGQVGGTIFDFSGTVTSNGYNLSSDYGGGVLTATGDQINTDPMLGPLQDNGGPTFTHALLPGSPAKDKGKNFSGSTNDQRDTGFVRTFDNSAIPNATGGDATDIGAFEVQTAYAAQIQQPINSDGSSVFSVRRGVVPVKFTLTLNGVSTCDLPPATIAVYRTGAGGNQQIDESIYVGPADTGSSFRIDSCQYVYNLSASALGVGTYEVDILINGQVVGTAAFVLK